jgi:hypothetical protein
VTEPAHQGSKWCAAGCRKGGARVAKIVKAETLSSQPSKKTGWTATALPGRCRSITESTRWARGQLGAFAVAGANLYVGRDPGEAITEKYSGEPPYGFRGGTIDRVAIDVSGEPYVDMEREAVLMLMREQWATPADTWLRGTTHQRGAPSSTSSNA